MAALVQIVTRTQKWGSSLLHDSGFARREEIAIAGEHTEVINSARRTIRPSRTSLGTGETRLGSYVTP